MTATGAYRDDEPGRMARLAELRATWKTKVDEMPPEVAAVVAARHARMAGGMAAVLAQVSVLAVMIAWWVQEQPISTVPRGMSECAKCGLGPAIEAGMVWITSPFQMAMLLAAAVLANRLGRVIGANVGQAQVKRLMGPPEMSPGLELEQLAHASPTRVLAAAGTRLERASLRWGIAARGLPFVIAPFVLSLELSNGIEPPTFLLWTAAVTLGLFLVAIGSACFAPPKSWLINLLVVGLPAVGGSVLFLSLVPGVMVALQLLVLLFALETYRQRLTTERATLAAP